MNKKDCICKKPARVFFTHLSPLCKGCFALLLRRRVRKAIQDFGWLKPNQKVFIDGEKAVSILFKSAVTGLPLKYVKKAKAEVIITGKTADDEAVEFLEQLFEGKIKQQEKALNIFANITEKELEKYCELEKIVRKKQKKSGLRQKLEKLDEKYPGIMFALQKSRQSFQP
jgi:tRNA(Ile)-lysidine synthase TilS/MesJ